MESRRNVLAGLAALGLSACGGAGLGQGVRPSARPGTGGARVNEFVEAPNPAWDAWVAAFKPRAVGSGIPQGVVEQAFADAGFIPAVIERDRNQAEVTRSFQDYLLTGVSDSRVENGQAALARVAPQLAAIESSYGVDKEVVVAVWGLESSYGTRKGEVPVVSALSTLAYEGRRAAFFEEQLLASLRILARGDTTPDRMKGSWAGAMGHTQFIPTSFESLAVDFTGDGRRDIWGDDPTDALASTANYLARSGWSFGEPAVRPAEGTSGGRVITPAGVPPLRVFSNFDVIKRYNNADSYAAAVGHLADRLKGLPPLPGVFPSERALTLPERVALQEALTERGFDTGGTDGNVGPRTIEAIRAFEASQGLPATGFATPSLLRRLR
jgi:lytic murein transglycosylase